jgi:hypothetical protein
LHLRVLAVKRPWMFSAISRYFPVSPGKKRVCRHF